MIRSWGTHGTKDVWDGRNTKAARTIPRALWPVVVRRLERIDAATVVDDLAVPPGHRLERLKGDRRGISSIRVNRQYRITFQFADGHAFEVTCEDYHR